MPELVQKNKSTYRIVKSSENFGGSGMTEKSTRVAVTLDDNDPVVKIPASKLGCSSPRVVRCWPLGLPCVVAWDGDLVNPGFRFDGYPDGEFEFLVEVKGT